MNSVQVKVSTFLAVILIAGGGSTPSISLAANLPVGDASSIPANHALLMRAAGQVMKADMVDESRSLLGEPQPAKVNDLLPEGSVLGTGKNSWAEIKWTSVVSRIWQDTVIQIKPCKRSVYLQEGSLRFQLKKDRPDKAPYDITTKVLQARVHGTTVYVECRKDVEKISVLEGNIDVINRQNKSVVHLTPGVVYEVRVLGTLKSQAPFVLIPPKSSEAIPENKTPIAEIPDIRLNPKKGELIFQDKLTRTIAYAANSKSILEDPMIGGENPIPSYSLIQDAVAKVPGFSMPDAIASMITNKPDRNLLKNFKIVAVPSTMGYAIGPNVGPNGFSLPQVAYTDLHPSGVATLDSRTLMDNLPVKAAAIPAPMFAPRPIGRFTPAPGEEFTETTSYLQTGPTPSVKIGEPEFAGSFDRTVHLGAIGSTALNASGVMQQFAATPGAAQMPVFNNPMNAVAGSAATQTAFNAASRAFALPQAPATTPFSSPVNAGVASDRRASDLVNINITGRPN